MKKPMATPVQRITDKYTDERPPPTDAWALWVIYCAAAGATIYFLFFARF